MPRCFLIPRTAALLLLPVLGTLTAHSEVSGLPTPPPLAASPESTISVNGTGRVTRTPNFVEVSLGVEVLDPVASAAQAGAERTMAAVIDAIRSLSLPGQELQPGTVELQPRYDDHREHSELPRIIGHKASISLSIRSTDLASPARVIDAAIKAGAARIDAVTFGIREALSAREEAIRLAADAAKRKARTLAAALDVRLGRIMTAGTTAGTYSWAPNRYANAMAQQSFEPAGGREAEDTGPIVPGKIEVWAEVSVTYSIAEPDHAGPGT
jgi:uncharacterized protein YggE